MQRKHLARLSTVVGIGLGIAAVAFVVRFLARDWDEVSDSLADARPGWVLAAFVTAGGGSWRYLWVLVVLPLGLVVLHHSVLERLRATGSRVTGREINVVIPAWKDSLALLASYVPAWLFVGTATWLVARG